MSFHGDGELVITCDPGVEVMMALAAPQLAAQLGTASPGRMPLPEWLTRVGFFDELSFTATPDGGWQLTVAPQYNWSEYSKGLAVLAWCQEHGASVDGEIHGEYGETWGYVGSERYESFDYDEFF